MKSECVQNSKQKQKYLNFYIYVINCCFFHENFDEHYEIKAYLIITDKFEQRTQFKDLRKDI